jgi:hypothetical protein
VGRRVPQLALDRLLTDDLAEVLEALDLDLPAGESPSRSGPCGEALARRGRDAAWMGRFLDLAGDARALSRAETWADALTRSTPDQCLYEGAMDALGFKGNRRPFRGLAERVTLERLRRLAPVDGDLAGRRRVIEAVLFNVAGLTPTEAEARDWDDASREYVTSLAEAWIPVASEFGQTRLARGMWQFGRTRPVNYPTRRIAAAAALLARHAHTGLFRAVVEALERAGSEATPAARARAARRGIEALFLLEGEGYWSRRCVFGGRPMARPARLLGPDRALGMVVNVIVPLVLACARGHQDAPLERLLHGVYASLGRMPDDSVTRYMGSRLFQDVETARRVAATARRQQGLFQLYHDFCEGRQTVCERCRFLALVSGEETAPC